MRRKMNEKERKMIEQGEWHEQRIPDTAENVVDAVLGVSVEQVREAMAAEQEADEEEFTS